MATPPTPAQDRCRSILEQLLKPLSPEADSLARDLVSEFGSLGAVLAASPDAITRVVGGNCDIASFLDNVRDAMAHSLRTDLEERPILDAPDMLRRYLHITGAHLGEEQVRVLFLNVRNKLIRDEVMLKGTVSAAQLYPREILKRALELGATALVLVHNHPSGDPEPSVADIEETKRLCEAASALDIAVHDHLIVARSGITSLRGRGLMGRSKAKPGALREEGRNLAEFAERLLSARSAIGSYFDPAMFADPAFDLLLLLFIATQRGQPISVKSCAAGAGLPPTTALRWIGLLEERGLVTRHENPLDRRSTHLTLGADAVTSMQAYLLRAISKLSA